jgi:hypothetical protein
MSSGISAQGTTIERNGTLIAELRDITPPALTRNTIDTTTHNDLEDSYVVGIRRKGDLSFMINYLGSGEATHGSSSGLVDAWQTGAKDLYHITFPDGAHWYFSGHVVNIAPTSPVDGAQTAQISVRPSGSMIIAP